MKKLILVMVFIFTTGTLITNANTCNEKTVDPVIKTTINMNPEKCFKMATEVPGLLAIWFNNSFEEEDEDFYNLFQQCMDSY
tara:strand:- start:4594 stop:4839 length:246 start_codon:yes stop_codon:yes gene_type:complete